jgi:hypothetical protein
MSQDIRRQLISRNLGIVPINHGQVYTFQIALPEFEKVEISLERYQAIENSLLQHQSNLVSLVIRRTDTYENEDIEYELVYGADWLQVAQDLGIEKLWAWVFDLNDEQVQSTKAELALLANSTETQPLTEETQSSNDLSLADQDLDYLLDRKLKLTTDSVRQVLISSLDKFKEDFDNRINMIHHKLDLVNQQFSEIPKLLEQLENLHQRLSSSGLGTKALPPKFDGVTVNLVEASDLTIANALEQIGTQSKEIEAALQAIKFWKQSPKSISWRNLEKSSKSKTGSQHKIAGFGKGTYERLRRIGEIPE